MDLASALNVKLGFIIIGFFTLLPIGGFIACLIYKRLGLPDPEYYKPGKKHH